MSFKFDSQKIDDLPFAADPWSRIWVYSPEVGGGPFCAAGRVARGGHPLVGTGAKIFRTEGSSALNQGADGEETPSSCQSVRKGGFFVKRAAARQKAGRDAALGKRHRVLQRR